MGRKKKEITIEEQNKQITEETPKKKFDSIDVGDLFLCQFKEYKYVIEIQWEKRGHFWLHTQYLKKKTSKSKKEEENYGNLTTVESARRMIEEKADEKITKAQYKIYLTEGI